MGTAVEAGLSASIGDFFIRWSMASRVFSNLYRRKWALMALAVLASLAISSMAFAQEAAAAAPPTAADAIAKVDNTNFVANTVWTLIAGMLVFWMNAGFATLETGLCRRKNAVNILAKNFIVFAISSIAFWAVGFAFMFGGTRSGEEVTAGKFIGMTGFFTSLMGEGKEFPGLSWALVPESVKFFFQLVFAGTAATIVSGAVAERIKFGSFMIFSFLLVAFVYPITGHWIWGGGWLGTGDTAAGKALFHDFAGSTVV